MINQQIKNQTFTSVYPGTDSGQTPLFSHYIDKHKRLIINNENLIRKRRGIPATPTKRESTDNQLFKNLGCQCFSQ